MEKQLHISNHPEACLNEEMKIISYIFKRGPRLEPKVISANNSRTISDWEFGVWFSLLKKIQGHTKIYRSLGNLL